MPTAGTTAHPSPPLQTYVVAKGDTFSTIAQRFGVTVERLLAANPSLKNPNNISVGDGIVIPIPSAGSIETPTPTSPRADLSRRRSRPRAHPIPPITDHPGPLRVDGFADVLVTDLAIRSKPATTDSKVLGRLTTGDRVFILKGPVEESGYVWYRVFAPEIDRSRELGEKPNGLDRGREPRDGEPWLEGRHPTVRPAGRGALRPMTSSSTSRASGRRHLADAGSGSGHDDWGLPIVGHARLAEPDPAGRSIRGPGAWRSCRSEPPSRRPAT